MSISIHSMQKTIRAIFVVFLLSSAIAPQPVQAQSITPANDGTGTLITPDGQRFDIHGGSLSGDGQNLFHSFEKFGLNPDQIANFLSNPTIRNILGRVVGGDASLIDGLIRVTGGNSNLYLMNPAGIVFGANARLDVPASFTATTANGILLGDLWFNASGINNYSVLIGEPTGFAFTMQQPGDILNAGQLVLGEGQTLMLVGGTVVNTGQLTVPEGQVIVTAVPGERSVLISQQGHLLSLKVTPVTPDSSQPNDWVLPITALPALLTMGKQEGNLGIQVNPDGTIHIVATNVNVPSESGIAIVSGKVDTTSQVGGGVGVFGEKVAVVGAEIDASGTNGGGSVLIGGDYKGQGTVPNALRTYVDSGSVIKADALEVGDGGKVIVWADEVTGFYGSISVRGGVISGNGGFVEVSGKENLIFRGQVDSSVSNGNPGTLLLDPANIIIVDGSGGAEDSQITQDSQILAGDSPGSTFTISENALEGLAASADVILEATNNITINDLTDNTLTFAAGPGGSILFKADADGNLVGSFSMNAGDSIIASGRDVSISGVNIIAGGITGKYITLTANEIDLANPSQISSTDTLRLQPYDTNLGITVGGTTDDERLNLNDVDLTELPSGFSQIIIGSSDSNGTITVNTVNFNNSISLRSPAINGNITVDGQIQTNGNSLTLEAGNNIDINADILTSGGDININSGNTIDSTGGTLDSHSHTSDGGNVTLTANNDINTGNIAAGTVTTEDGNKSTNNGNGGAITITSSSGSIDTTSGVLNTSTQDNDDKTGGFDGGTITLEASGDITVSVIDSSGDNLDNRTISEDGCSESTCRNGFGGDITLFSSGTVETTDLINSLDGQGSVSGEVSISGSEIDLNSGTSSISANSVKLQSEVGDIRFGVNSDNGNDALDLTITELETIYSNELIISTIDELNFIVGEINIGSEGAVDLSTVLGIQFLQLEGNIVLNNNFTLNDFYLTIDGAITISPTNNTDTADIIIGRNGTLDLFIRSGSVGTADRPLITEVGTINLNPSSFPEDPLGDVFIRNNISLRLGNTFTNIDYPGNVNLTTTAGDINNSGTVTIGGNSTFTTEEPNAVINLDQLNTTGTISLNTTGSGGNVTLINSSDLNLGTSNVGGNLTATSTGGNIIDNGTVTVGGSSIFSTTQVGANISLDQLNTTGIVSLNTTGINSNATITKVTEINLGDSNIQGSLNATSITGNIIDSGTVTVSGNSAFTTVQTDADITLDQLNANGTINLNTTGIDGNATIINSTDTDLGISNIGGNLTVTATTGNIMDSGTVTVAGNSAFTTVQTDADITLDQLETSGITSLNTIGADGNAIITGSNISLETADIGGNLTVTAITGGIIDTGTVTVGGNSSFTTQQANADIILDQLNTSGTTSFNTTDTDGNVTITTTGIQLETSNIGGNLTIISTAGDITDNGTVTVGGNSSFTTQQADADITLDQLNTAETISFSTTGADGNATLTNATDINLEASSVSGNLSITATSGNINDNGTVTVGGNSSFTTNQSDADITLDRLNTSGTISLNTVGTDGNATFTATNVNLGISNIEGNLNVIATDGNIIDSGTVTVAGNISFTTIQNNANITLDQLNASGTINLSTTGTDGNATIINATDTNLGISNIGGTLTVTTTTGDINDNGILTVGGHSSFSTTQSDADITLDQLATNSTVSFNTTGTDGNVIITGSDISLETANIGGNLTVTAIAGDINNNGTITVGGNSSFTTQQTDVNITLDQLNTNGNISFNTVGTDGNVTIAADEITLGSSNIEGNISTTATTGNITDNGVVNVDGNSSFTTQQTDADIILDQLSTNGTISFNTNGSDGNVTITTDNINLESSNIGGNLTVTTTAGDIVDSGTVTVGGNSSFTSTQTDTDITLDQLNTTGTVSFNTTGTDSNTTFIATEVKLGTSNIEGNLNIIATNGNIDDSGTLTVNGNSSFTTTQNNADITLDQLDTDSTIALNTVGTDGNATITNATNTKLGTSNVGGNLTVTSTDGNISNTGIVTVDGNSTFTTQQIDADITLNPIDTNGTMSFNTTGTDGNVTITAGEINLETSNIGGNLAVTATTGNITDSGTVTIGGNSSFTTEQEADIILDQLDTDGLISLNTNSFDGDVTLTSTTLNLNESLILGNLTATATTGNITTNGQIDVEGNITFTGKTIILNDRITGNAVNITANGNLNTTNITANSDIALTSFNGDINIGNLNTSDSEDSGGNITITSEAGSVTTGNVLSSGRVEGGNITINARTSITTGQINTSSVFGNGGNVTLDPSGDVQVGSINTQGGNDSRGGNVFIESTDGFVRVTRSFTDQNGTIASISTAGGENGSITIRHAGGPKNSPVAPFEIGDGTFNGTAAALTTGEFTISPSRIFPESFQLGNISLETDDLDNDDNLLLQFPPLPLVATKTPTCAAISFGLSQIDDSHTQEFNYLGELARKPSEGSAADACSTLSAVAESTGVTPAIIYVNFTPGYDVVYDGKNLTGTSSPATEDLTRATQPKDNDQLELILITPDGPAIRKRISGATRAKVMVAANNFQKEVFDRYNAIDNKQSYLDSAKLLYEWLVEPLKDELDKQKIENLTFIMETGLRSLPIAALYDARKNQFLVEQYSLGLMPSLSLTDLRSTNLKNSQLLAMGASEFSDKTSLPLPAVPDELKLISQDLWQRGKSFPSEDFTPEKLKEQRQQTPFAIIHLATHGQFSDAPYIQFRDGPRSLEELRQKINWTEPPVKLLVLSACETALGDAKAELGFAGLAAKIGVQSVLGSLTKVDWQGTLPLMAEFYSQLAQAPIKAEALRQAQLALLKENVKYQDQQLILSDGRQFPIEARKQFPSNVNLTHPYYWASFVLIGNPW